MNTPNLLWWKTSVAVLCLWAVVLVAVAYLRFGGVHGHVRLAGVHTAAFAVPADIAPPAPSHSGSGPLLEASQVVYRGAFRLPAESVNGSSFAYGGTGLAFNPARNSLFVVGHDWHQMVAEIAVPEIRASSSLDSLATATLLQPFADVTEGKLGKLGAAEMKIGGLLPYDGKLYASGTSITTPQKPRSSPTLCPERTWGSQATLAARTLSVRSVPGSSQATSESCRPHGATRSAAPC